MWFTRAVAVKVRGVVGASLREGIEQLHVDIKARAEAAARVAIAKARAEAAARAKAARIKARAEAAARARFKAARIKAIEEAAEAAARAKLMDFQE